MGTTAHDHALAALAGSAQRRRERRSDVCAARGGHVSGHGENVETSGTVSRFGVGVNDIAELSHFLGTSSSRTSEASVGIYLPRDYNWHAGRSRQPLRGCGMTFFRA